MVKHITLDELLYGIYEPNPSDLLAFDPWNGTLEKNTLTALQAHASWHDGDPIKDVLNTLYRIVL